MPKIIAFWRVISVKCTKSTLETTSRKIVLTALSCVVVLLLLGLTACGGNGNEEVINEPTDPGPVVSEPTPAPAPEVPVVPVGDTPLADVVIQVDGDAMLIASSGRYPGDSPILLNDHAAMWQAGGILYWEIEVNRPGLYIISLNYEVDAGQGGTGLLEVGGLSATFQTAPTTDGLSRLDVMEANLPAGSHRLVITAQDANTSLMNLRRVALVKLPDTVPVSGEAVAVLSPMNALLHGPANAGGAYIGNWGMDDRVEWALGVEEAGRYEVEMTFTAEGNARGMLTGFGRDVEFNLDGGSHTTVVGDIVLNAGNRTLRIEPLELGGNYFINLERVTLTRTGDPAVRVEGDVTVLRHTDAVVAGGAGIQSDDIGGWVQGASATWPLDVQRAGNYAVTVYAAAPDGMGGIVGMNFIHMLHPFEVVPTGDWGNYAPNDAGIIGLRQGAYDLMLQGIEYNDNWMMNLHQIVLTYVGDFGPILVVDGETTLPVSGAVTIGGAVVENNWRNVGGWRRGYGVEFTLDVVNGGDFDIYLNHAGGGGTGGPGILEVNGTEIPIYIEDTGDWGNYQENNYGVISLAPGTQTIRILSTDESQEWFMNLEHIRLVPR